MCEPWVQPARMVSASSLSFLHFLGGGGRVKEEQREDVRTEGKSPLYYTDSATLSLAAVISLD